MMQISEELEDFLNNTFKIRKALEQVLPRDAVDYLINLIVKDGAHRNFLKLTEENENEYSKDHADKE